MNTSDLEVLKRDFETALPILEPLIQGILEQEVSKYPILIATKEVLGLGLPVPGLDNLDLRWQFRISVLEELVQKKVVLREKVDDFKIIFDDPVRKACLLVVTDRDAQVITMPFPDASQRVI